MDSFLLAFIPLFVAIDVLGVLPMFVGITEGLEDPQRRRLVRQATATAFTVSVVFLVTGKVVFTFLGITESDFRVGGGIVLLVLSVHDLLFSHEVERAPGDTVGVVPLGVPLIMGPAALTTIIYLVDAHGYVLALLSLVVNLLIVWQVFARAQAITRILGKAGSKAFAKVAALFMAAIAVMMIRSGVQGMLAVS
jgi:multiple antibiotic resistance protein